MRERVEVENKKNNDSLSTPCYPVNRYCLLKKLSIEKKRKNADRIQTKLNAPNFGYNVKILSQ